jgi:NAD(P)-dependent dehydrogenase (short-subunit alcohol dehydrogenase family)
MSKSFGAESTTNEVLEGVNLSGKRVLVTGVSAGLGVETARVLAAHGAEVVGAARNLAKAKEATAPVRAGAANGGSLELAELDLASLKSVRACADALVANGKPFDLVICNAGVMATPFGKTADGFETQFGTNHLGHFVLVNRIASLMKPGRGWSICRPPAIRFPTSILTIRTSSAHPTAHGRPTAVRRPPTSCSRSSSTAATRIAVSGRRPSILAPFRPNSAATWTRKRDGS